MAQFDPQVKTQERRGELAGVQTEIPQRIGKSKPVQQSETERHHPAAFRKEGDQIIEGGEHHRGSDGGFNQPRWQMNVA